MYERSESSNKFLIRFYFKLLRSIYILLSVTSSEIARILMILSATNKSKRVRRYIGFKANSLKANLNQKYSRMQLC